MNNFNLGVSSVLFKHEPLEIALKYLNENNEKIIDLVFAPPVFCPHYNPLKATNNDNLKLKEMLNKYSFTVSSLNVVPGQLNVGDVEKTVRFIINSILLCKFLNVKILTIPSGSKVKKYEWMENVNSIKQRLTELVKFAGDNNVNLSIEAPHANTITESIDEVVKFVDVVNLPDLKLTFDTSHARLFHKYDITEAFKIIGKEIINHVHIRDTLKGSVNLTPGTGTCDFRKFFKHLSSINYNGYVIYELEYHKLSNKKIMEELEFAKKYINSVINNEKVDLSLKIKTNKYFNIAKRFKDQPKEELNRHPKLFKSIRFLADPVMRLRSDKVFLGQYKKKLRPFKSKITNLKKNSISISSQKQLNIGIIGLGNVGYRWHAVGLDSIKEVNIIGGFDLHSEKNILFSNKYKTKVYNSIDELLKKDLIDLVLISTREWQHYNIIKKAFDNNIDVFCEKILTPKISEAENLVQLSKEKKKFFAINYNYHYLPGVIKIKEFIDNGKLGYLGYINITAHSTAYSHAIDLVRYLGKDITSVSAVIRDDDKLRNNGIDWSKFDESIQYFPTRATSATFTYNDGSYAVLNSTDLYDINKMIISIEAVFEKDILVLNGINMYNTIGILSNSQHKKVDYDLNIKKDVYTKRFGYSFFESIKDTITRYAHNKKPPTSGEEALFNLKLEDLIFESSKSGKKIHL